MVEEGHVPNPPPARRLWLLTAIAAVLGSIVAVLFVLPVEFHMDWTGFGKMVGLDRLAGPEEIEVTAPEGGAALSHISATAYRTDTIEIPLGSDETGGVAELEYKVGMKKDDTIVYSWEVTPAPPDEEFYYDLHSQSDPQPKVLVLSHKQATGTKENGSLTAPFDGIHGWYFQNQSVMPVKVTLHLAGFYRLVSAEELAAAAAQAPPAFPLEPPPDAESPSAPSP